jgi:O-antigen/teichoic acid export membrane protein
VTPLRLLAVYGLIRAFAAPTGEVFKGLGRPHLSLLFEFLYSLPLVAGLLLLVPRIGVNGAPLALLIAQCFAALPAVATGMRMLRVRPRELVGALASPVAAAGVLALVLLATLSVTNRFSTALSFARLVGVGCFGYVLGVGLLARDVVVPMWANLRTKRA